MDEYDKLIAEQKEQGLRRVTGNTAMSLDIDAEHEQRVEAPQRGVYWLRCADYQAYADVRCWNTDRGFCWLYQ